MPKSSGRQTAPFSANLWSNGEPNGKGKSGNQISSCIQFSSTYAADDEFCSNVAHVYCHIYNVSAPKPVVQRNLVDSKDSPTSGSCPAPWIKILNFYYYYNFSTLYNSVPEALAACRSIHPDATLPLDPLGAYGQMEYLFQY
uniref:Uncharacterized protein n=1 Tax=Romanomermis culicivorax TaxID=13658 RepID=A0A915I2A2_ROMCU